MTPSPYAPPRAAIADSGTLAAKRNEPLPPVCLKCASRHEVVLRTKSLAVAARSRLFRLGLVLIVGVIVATVRSHELRIYLFFGVAVAALIVGRFAYPRVELGLPLCPHCEERWKTGVRWSKILRAAVFVSSVIMTAATLAGVSVLIVLLFAVAVFGAAVGLASLRMRSRIVVIKELKGDVATLWLVHPDAVAVIESVRSTRG